MSERANKWGDPPCETERTKRTRVRRLNNYQQDQLKKAVHAMTAKLEVLIERIEYLESAVGVLDQDDWR